MFALDSNDFRARLCLCIADCSYAYITLDQSHRVDGTWGPLLARKARTGILFNHLLPRPDVSDKSFSDRRRKPLPVRLVDGIVAHSISVQIRLFLLLRLFEDLRLRVGIDRFLGAQGRSWRIRLRLHRGRSDF